MKKRPKSLLILVGAFALVPVFNIFFTSFFVHIAPHRYFMDYLRFGTMGEILGTFLIPWAAAVSLYICNRWSYVLFAVLMGIVFAQNLETWLEYPNAVVRAGVIATALANISVMVFLALSENHKLFLNSNLRWWETPARYRVNLNAKILGGENTVDAKITDLSINGLFVEAPKHLEMGVPVDLAFSLEEFNLAIKAKAIRRQENDRIGYGMMIEHTPETRSEMKQIITKLKVQGVPTTQSYVQVSQNV